VERFEWEKYGDAGAAVLRETFTVLVKALAPVVPHVTHVLWAQISDGSELLEASWPEIDSQALQTEFLQMVVQVNGKLRAKIQVPVDAGEEVIRELALADAKVAQYVDNSRIRKCIVVPKRLINIVVG
jgi:leucyl-tRNA synthetase